MANERSLKWHHENKHRIDKEKRKEYMENYRQKNRDKWKRTPEQQAEINRRRREKYANDKEYRESQKSKAKEWQESNPAKRKAQRLKKFGIDLETYNSMLIKQNNKCLICGYSDMKSPIHFPVVDHCHITGMVRGLLCMNCNTGLGSFKDNIEFLKSAIIYLEEVNS